jgi:hypothetical protein
MEVGEHNYDAECIICYNANQQDLLRPCLSCNTAVCASCWYDACRMYCPVCCRYELNVPKQCSYCCKTMHIKDVWACCVCCSWVCKSCELFTTVHPCRILRDCTKLTDAHDITSLCFIRILQGITSCPLGRIYKTTLSAAMRDTHVVIWFHCKSPSEKRFARNTKMKKIELHYGNIIAFKKYYVLHKKVKLYIDAFLAKCIRNT